MRHTTCITLGALAALAGGFLTTAAPKAFAQDAGTTVAVASRSGAARVDVPRGTDIPVVLDEDIKITSEQVGKSFEAHVSRDVVVDGQVAIPEGTAAAVRLEPAAEDAERVTLRLAKLRLDGELRTVLTEDARAETEKDKAGTAEKTGIGAAAGAVIGAVTGAGVVKGAIIGAGGGLAWGLASGSDSEVGEGTRLYFSLAEDLETR